MRYFSANPRRRTTIEVASDPATRDWWDACTCGSFDRIRYDLRCRQTNNRIAQATVWMLDPLSRSWGVRAVGLVEAEKRGKQVFYTLRLPCTLRFIDCVDRALEERGY